MSDQGKTWIMTPWALWRMYFKQERIVSCWILLVYLVKCRQKPLDLGIWLLEVTLFKATVRKKQKLAEFEINLTDWVMQEQSWECAFQKKTFHERKKGVCWGALGNDLVECRDWGSTESKDLEKVRKDCRFLYASHCITKYQCSLVSFINIHAWLYGQNSKMTVSRLDQFPEFRIHRTYYSLDICPMSTSN